MGMILTDADGVADVSGIDFWKGQLQNDKILLHEIDKAILFFNTSTGAGAIQSYTIDTGQDKQTVTRADMATLQQSRTALIKEISQIEQSLNADGGRRIVPGF